MIPVVRVKIGVKFDTIAPAGFEILAAIADLPHLIGQDVTITCGTDSHPLPDPHCTGEAYDVGVRDWLPIHIVNAVMHLRNKLGSAFYTHYETNTTPADPTLTYLAVVSSRATGPHLHIQRAKGTIYP